MDKSKVKFTVITGGGIGSRVGTTVPKQFSVLAGLPVLMHTINRFRQFDANMTIILTLPKDSFSHWSDLCVKYNFTQPKTIAGGKTRFHSVQNALREIPEEGIVAVHDAVRPLVSLQTLKFVFKAAELYGCAVPVCELPFSLRKVTTNKSEAVERARYKEVQTPQVFSAKILHKAYSIPYSDTFTDDASVAEAAGYDIHLTQGNRENIKITYPVDLRIAETLLEQVE